MPVPDPRPRPPTVLDRVLGPESADEFLRYRAAEVAVLDCFHPDHAHRLVCERAAHGDPLVLAAARQTWALREDADPDDAPGETLAIQARLTAPPRVCVLADGHEEAGELPIDVLRMYRLTAWDGE